MIIRKIPDEPDESKIDKNPNKRLVLITIKKYVLNTYFENIKKYFDRIKYVCDKIITL